MKLPIAPKLNGGEKVDPAFYKTLVDLLGSLSQTTNKLSEGRIEVHYNATNAAPTDGLYAVGDFVKNSEPEELGSSSSKYVIEGWMCISSDPLTFVEKRFLTGN